MLIKAIALSATAGLLIASAAQAQDAATSYTDTTRTTQKGPQDQSSSMSTGMSSSTSIHTPSMSSSSTTTVNPTYSTSYPSASAATTYSTDVAATYPASTSEALATGGTVQLVTSMPVADTPANRARYTPLSATGRRTAPRGN